MCIGVTDDVTKGQQLALTQMRQTIPQWALWVLMGRNYTDSPRPGFEHVLKSIWLFSLILLGLGWLRERELPDAGFLVTCLFATILPFLWMWKEYHSHKAQAQPQCWVSLSPWEAHWTLFHRSSLILDPKMERIMRTMRPFCISLLAFSWAWLTEVV